MKKRVLIYALNLENQNGYLRKNKKKKPAIHMKTAQTAYKFDS